MVVVAYGSSRVWCGGGRVMAVVFRSIGGGSGSDVLKEHNPEVDWQTGKVEMSHCSPRCCNGC